MRVLPDMEIVDRQPHCSGSTIMTNHSPRRWSHTPYRIQSKRSGHTSWSGPNQSVQDCGGFPLTQYPAQLYPRLARHRQRPQEGVAREHSRPPGYPVRHRMADQA